MGKRIELEDVGLSAYIKMFGGKLLGIKPEGKRKLYQFEIEGEFESYTVEEWRIKYLNSCCQRHDLEVITLRKLKSIQS